jgi:hypothetical protein
VADPSLAAVDVHRLWARASRSVLLFRKATIAAIRELEIAGVRAAFLNAIQAAMVRARELAAGDP